MTGYAAPDDAVHEHGPQDAPDGRAGADGSATLQSRLQRRDGAGAGAEASIENPAALILELEASGRFHRDTGVGRIFHPGKISFRENLARNSLHISIHDDVISAHVDRVSPLAGARQGSFRYSLRRAAEHNIAGMAEDLVRLVRGRQGDHRCELDCEWAAGADSSVDGLAGDPPSAPEPVASNIQLEARVAGVLDEERLLSALRTALRGGAAGDCDHQAAVTVARCDDDESLAAARTELQSAPASLEGPLPLRATLARCPGGDVLMLNLNHAAIDGFGAMEVLRAVAAAYSSKDHPLPAIEFLALQRLPVRPAPPSASAWRRRYRAVVDGLRDLLSAPARLSADGAVDEAGYGYHLVESPIHEVANLSRVERPGTARNIMVAALHLAVGSWNAEHGRPGGRISVLVPVNLRPQDWPGGHTGNFSVNARVSTTRRERSGPAKALQAVTAQTKRNKRTRTGTALIEALHRNGLLPLWAKQSSIVLQPVTGNRFLDSVLFANLGRIDEPVSFGADAGEIRGLWFSAPARTPEGISLGAVTLSGQLHLCVRYPRRLFDEDAACRFADCYLAHLRLVADQA